MSAEKVKEILLKDWDNFFDKGSRPNQVEQSEIFNRVDVVYPILHKLILKNCNHRTGWLNNDLVDIINYHSLPVMKKINAEQKYLDLVEEKQKKRIKAQGKLIKARQLLLEVTAHLTEIECYKLDCNELSNLDESINAFDVLIKSKLNSYNPERITRVRTNKVSRSIEELNKRLVKYDLGKIFDGSKDRQTNSKATKFGNALNILIDGFAYQEQNRYKDRKKPKKGAKTTQK